VLVCANAPASRRVAATPRMVKISSSFTILLSIACVPDLQPQYPQSQCVDGGQRLSYDDAPDSLKTHQLDDTIVQYSALAGQWEVDIRCPPDSPAARTLGFVVETRPRRDIGFQPLCSGGIEAVTKCRVSFSGQDFPELAGQSSEFDVLLSPGSGMCIGRLYPEADYACAPQKLDPSYDSTWDFLAAGFTLDSTNALSGYLNYGFKPYQNAQGGMSQAGYDCTSTSAVRVGP